jgi:hypothetical protein
LGQLKSTLYARMEEVSFRSGAAVAGGVLTAAGVAITLAVVLGGDSDAVASAGLPPRDPLGGPPGPGAWVLLAAGHPAAQPDDGPRDRGPGLPAPIGGQGGRDPACCDAGPTATPRRLVPRRLVPRAPGPPDRSSGVKTPPIRGFLTPDHRRRDSCGT